MSAPIIPDDAPWKEGSFAVLDLEGNGQQPPDLVELAVIPVDAGAPGPARAWLIKPGQKITQQASNIHGITNSEVARAPTFAQIRNEVFEALHGRYLVAHNASVDWGVLSRKLPRLQPPAVLDTLRLARALCPDQDSYSLSGLLTSLGLQVRLAGTGGQLHRAAYDAAAALQIFLHLAERTLKGQLSFRHLIMLSELPEFTQNRQGSLF